jgi:hypothetical protein
MARPIAAMTGGALVGGLGSGCVAFVLVIVIAGLSGDLGLPILLAGMSALLLIALNGAFFGAFAARKLVELEGNRLRHSGSILLVAPAPELQRSGPLFEVMSDGRVLRREDNLADAVEVGK